MLILLEAVEGELCILVNSLYQSIIFRLLVILLCINAHKAIKPDFACRYCKTVACSIDLH